MGKHIIGLSCSNCRFFCSWHATGSGHLVKCECRRHAPVTDYKWPEVKKSDFCGEHEEVEN